MIKDYTFGYGSLVNRNTHGFETVHRARLTGWRRIWRHTNLRPVAYLSVTPDPECVLDGLIMAVAAHDADLAQRERGYVRELVNAQVTHPAPHDPSIQLFTVDPDKHAASDKLLPIYLSYLDVVVQGYYREYGEAGVHDFFETTSGWDAPILDDRAAPQYPRHQRLDADETALTDAWLGQLSAVVKHL